jgi:hypothetical protein
MSRLLCHGGGENDLNAKAALARMVSGRLRQSMIPKSGNQFSDKIMLN